jgi:hypothetical protein
MDTPSECSHAPSRSKVRTLNCRHADQVPRILYPGSSLVPPNLHLTSSLPRTQGHIHISRHIRRHHSRGVSVIYILLFISDVIISEDPGSYIYIYIYIYIVISRVITPEESGPYTYMSSYLISSLPRSLGHIHICRHI